MRRTVFGTILTLALCGASALSLAQAQDLRPAPTMGVSYAEGLTVHGHAELKVSKSVAVRRIADPARHDEIHVEACSGLGGRDHRRDVSREVDIARVRARGFQGSGGARRGELAHVSVAVVHIGDHAEFELACGRFTGTEQAAATAERALTVHVCAVAGSTTMYAPSGPVDTVRWRPAIVYVMLAASGPRTP